jgi:hypothetical protein
MVRKNSLSCAVEKVSLRYWIRCIFDKALIARRRICRQSCLAGFQSPSVPHLARDWHHDLPGERRTARARPTNGRHESPRTTKLYDRTKDEITLELGGADPAVTFDPKLRCRGERNAHLRSEPLYFSTLTMRAYRRPEYRTNGKTTSR